MVSRPKCEDGPPFPITAFSLSCTVRLSHGDPLVVDWSLGFFVEFRR